MLNKFIKAVIIIFGSIVAMLALLIVLIKFGYLNDYLAEAVSNYSNKKIHGELHIEFIEGNIFSDFNLHNISLIKDQDTIVTCNEIEIDYSIKKLLSKEININKLIISDLYIDAKQDADSVWNYENIYSLANKEDATKNEFNWKIRINDFNLINFTSEINQISKNNFVPEYAESNLKLRADIQNDSLKVYIDTFNLYLKNPDIEIAQFEGLIKSNFDDLTWEDIYLELNSSILNSEGKLNLKHNGLAYLNIDIKPFNVNDISLLFPDIELYGTPDITASLRKNKDQYNFNFNITQNQQKIDVTGWIKDIEGIPEYKAGLIVDSLNGEYWTQDEQFKSVVIGNLTLKGKGLNFEDNEIEVQGEFGNVQYGDYRLKDLVINTSKNKNQVKGNLNSNTWLGKLNLRYDLKNIFSNPVYDIYCDYKNLNLKGFPGIDSISTNLNGDISFKGQGTSIDELNAKFIINSQNSQLQDYPINDFEIQATYNKGIYSFEGLHFDTPYFLLDAIGNGNLYESNNIEFEFEPRNIYDLVSEFEMPIYNVEGKITGNISGAIDSLIGNANLALDNIQYDSLYLEQLNANIQANIIDSVYNGIVSFSGEKINYNGISINTLNFSNTFSNNLIKMDLKVNVSDSLQAYFLGDIEGFENPLIRFYQLDINYNNTKWSNRSDSMYILLDPEYVFINRFHLNSGTQNLNIHGYFTFEGEEKLDIKIDKFKLSQIPTEKYLPYSVTGILSSRFIISGTATEPIVENQLNIDSVNINNYGIENINAQMTYKDELLNSTGNINSKLHEFFKVSFSVPLHFSFSDDIYLIKDNPNLKASFKFDSLDLRKIYTFYPLEDISVKGLAYADLKLTNSINEPNFNGTFDLVSGSFENKAFGAIYKNIQMKSSIENNHITINKFNAATNKKGKLDIKGFVSLKSKLSPIPDDFQLEIKSTNFQALNSKRAELNFDSDLLVKGTFEDPYFKGNIKIRRSKFNADYFGNYLNQKTDDPNPPLLIKAMQDTVLYIEDNDVDKFGLKFSGTNFYKNLNGEATVQFPGNTWVKGKDVNLELEGSVQAIKSSDNLDLFGTLKVKRGSYKIYGKNFIFNKGELTFTGGKEINPLVDFIVLYRFRDIEQQLRKLTLNITGRVLQPELKFKLDEQSIEEKDAIAYIVFSKSVNQLSDNQLNKLMSNDNVALNLALGQISNILMESLPFTTRLDVVEITGENNWKTSSVTLGKYITNKLYLSYEQSFILDKKTKSVNTEKFMLEYQILRNLILKATNQSTNSGFDLIIKKSWK